MKFSSQPAVQFNGLWKTIEQWLEGRKDFLLHAFAKPNIQLLPLLSLPISSQSCRSFVCTVYFHFSRAEIMHKLCNHSHVYLWPFLNGVCAACTTSYSTEYLYIAQNSLFFPLSDKRWETGEWTQQTQCSPGKVVPALTCSSCAALEVEQGTEGSSCTVCTEFVLTGLLGVGDIVRCDGDSGCC